MRFEALTTVTICIVVFGLLKMEAISSSETFLTTYKIAWYRILGKVSLVCKLLNGVFLPVHVVYRMVANLSCRHAFCMTSSSNPPLFPHRTDPVVMNRGICPLRSNKDEELRTKSCITDRILRWRLARFRSRAALLRTYSKMQQFWGHEAASGSRDDLFMGVL
jgi:hypothetical protein